MIQINDNDLPITAAAKIITGGKANHPTPLMQQWSRVVTGDEHAIDTTDMFTLKDLKEIADYLLIFYETHKNRDEVEE